MRPDLIHIFLIISSYIAPFIVEVEERLDRFMVRVLHSIPGNDAVIVLEYHKNIYLQVLLHIFVFV